MSTPDKIHLDVPYSQKDQAKMLGARWDPLAKKWYLSPGTDLENFKPWLPADLLAVDSGPSCVPKESAPEDTSDTKGLSLSRFLGQVALAITNQVPKSQWVRAEISQFRALNGGHIALELAEHTAEGKLQARLQGFIWNGRAQGLLDKFEQATGAHLTTGLKVMLQLSADFNATYGLRAVIEDIDPTYTLGDIAAKLKAIRDTLIQEGIFTLNKALPSPAEFCRVAVISPKEAAGLGDFRQDANRLEEGGICRFTYYTATFQGEDAPRSILSVITDLRLDIDSGQSYDAVCIIRGGGSVTDLYWLNDHALADALCRLTIPVFTGIGHERDNTILDEVAHQRFDTPSKVIGHISGTVYANANQALENLLLLLKATGNILATHEQRVDRLRVEIQSNAKTQLLTTEHELERQLAHIQSDSLGIIRNTEFELIRLLDFVQQQAQCQITATNQDLDNLKNLISHFGHQRLSEMELSIEGLAREILGVGPKATLSRGFSLARDEKGQPITSAQKARAIQQFDLEFHDGEVTVKVTDPP